MLSIFVPFIDFFFKFESIIKHEEDNERLLEGFICEGYESVTFYHTNHDLFMG